MNYIVYWIFIFFVFLVGLIPFKLLYILSDFTRFILYRVIGYRKNVIETNLRNSFPEWSEDQYKKVIHGVYKNLTDIFIEGIKTFTLSKKQAVKRYKILNPEVVDQYYKQNKSVILVMGHYGNWEWGTLAAPLKLACKKVAILYKPLSNPYIDKYMRKTRSRTGASMVSIYNTLKIFKEQKNVPTVFIMVADQSPGTSKIAIWTSFLGQETAFLQGPEKYAKAFDLPVVFVNTTRVKRGFYEMELSVLCENPSSLKKGELTNMFAQKLESIIRNHPEDWLWSHKRWKMKRN